MKPVFKNGCVISVCQLSGGKYKHKIIRLDGAITMATLKSIRDFVFSDPQNIMPDSKGERCGTICDEKSFGKDSIPNKGAKLVPFGREYGEKAKKK